ncbi:PqqD family peptide modification chaperone [Candidatus Aerophobetes bacterium]|nr:PqqD family peptide modification chaperone [Candidatus Aerophobetes bacterium]
MEKERSINLVTKGSLPATRIGIIVSSRQQIHLAQDFITTFCDRFNLEDKYVFRLHLIIEEFLVNLFEKIGDGREIPFYLDYRERALRVIFDISGTGFRPVIADFSPLEFERDEETQDLMGLTIIKRLVDSIKQIKEGEKDEVHFIMYVGDEDFKDVYGLPKRYPVFRKNDVIVSKIKNRDKIQYNIRLKDKDDIFSVSEKSYFIIQRLDGKHSIGDLVREFTEKYGYISPGSVNHFIDTLKKKGFLEPELDIAYGREYEEEEVKISLLEKILSLQYSFSHVDRIVSSVYKKFKWVFSKPVVALIALSLGAFFYEFYHRYTNFHMGYVFKENANNPWIIIIYYIIMLITVVSHEFAHALTCKRYGGQVNKMGIMLYYFQICAYADTSDAWLFKERYKRILTALNGPLWSLFLASICLWGYYMVTPIIPGTTSQIHSWLWHLGKDILHIHNTFPEGVEQVLIMVMTLNFLMSIFNLMPFTETDGYYVFTDLINSPNIRMLSMGYVLNFFRRLLKKPPYPINPPNLKAKIGYAIYGSLCLLFGAAAVLFILYFLIFQHKIAFHSVFGILIIVSVTLYVLKSIFLKKIQRKREFLRRKVISY